VPFPGSHEPTNTAMNRLWSGLNKFLVNLLVLFVRIYQYTLSPLVGQQCRFVPSCSNYFIEAVQKYGAIPGTYRGVRRICRCNPWYRGSVFDPP
jgi:putative membrane protein insertion efficiency factor